MICLDTNAVSGFWSGRRPLLRNRIRAALTGEPIGLPVIVLFELRHGVLNSPEPEKQRRRIRDVLNGNVAVSPLDRKMPRTPPTSIFDCDGPGN